MYLSSCHCFTVNVQHLRLNSIQFIKHGNIGWNINNWTVAQCWSYMHELLRTDLSHPIELFFFSKCRNIFRFLTTSATCCAHVSPKNVDPTIRGLLFLQLFPILRRQQFFFKLLVLSWSIYFPLAHNFIFYRHIFSSIHQIVIKLKIIIITKSFRLIKVASCNCHTWKVLTCFKF